MFDYQSMSLFTIFIAAVLFIIWRPFGINESVPSTIGAVIIFLAGFMPLADVFLIFEIVSGAALTILSTIVMSIVLESIGFFRWAAFNLARNAQGSGIKLFWNINLLCFLMTLFFNNDGSILITTPIIIQTLKILNLKPNQKVPYLLSGVLIATAASAPIGVSNLANLIALKIVGLDLNSYAAMMFIPSMLGIATISFLLYLYFKKAIPIRLTNLKNANYHLFIAQLEDKNSGKFHPLKKKIDLIPTPKDWKLFKICIVIVVGIRASFFALAPFEVSTELPAVAGALLLIAVRWYYTKKGAMDIIKKTPWYIILFAFSMYVIVYAMYNSGLNFFLLDSLQDHVSSSDYNAIFIMGLLLTLMSNSFNNLPSVMIGTLTITEMNLDVHTMQVAYLANIIGSDIGALILPMGTLATLIWMFILRQNHIHITWFDYLKVTILVIPLGLIVSLLSLYFWTNWFF